MGLGFFIDVIVVVMWLPLKRYFKSYKEVEKQSKAMYQRWLIEESLDLRCIEKHSACAIIELRWSSPRWGEFLSGEPCLRDWIQSKDVMSS